MSLPVELKQKYKKGAVIELDGVLQINDEMKRLFEIDRKIIEEAGACEFCGKPYEIKTGRFGKFLACTGYPECKTIKNIKTGKVTRVTEKEEKTKTKKAVSKKTAKKSTSKVKSSTAKKKKTATAKKKKTTKKS